MQTLNRSSLIRGRLVPPSRLSSGDTPECWPRRGFPPQLQGPRLPTPVPREGARRAGVRERAPALDDDWPDVFTALRAGLEEDKDAGRAARTAIAYVQLVYGRQLQQPVDEQPTDPLHVSAMTREQRDALKRRILEQHPELVDELTRYEVRPRTPRNAREARGLDPTSGRP